MTAVIRQVRTGIPASIQRIALHSIKQIIRWQPEEGTSRVINAEK